MSKKWLNYTSSFSFQSEILVFTLAEEIVNQSTFMFSFNMFGFSWEKPAKRGWTDVLLCLFNVNWMACILLEQWVAETLSKVLVFSSSSGDHSEEGNITKQKVKTV